MNKLVIEKLMMPDSQFIVLTGGSPGLGRAMTTGFIDAGHIVVGLKKLRLLILCGKKTTAEGMHRFIAEKPDIEALKENEKSPVL